MQQRKKREGLKRSTNTYEKIIKTATRLFSIKGFSGTSIRDIAKHTRTTTSIIYYYFPSKTSIVLEIGRQTVEPIIEEFVRISNLDLPPIERLSLLIRTHLTYMKKHLKESKILTVIEETLPVEVQTFNREFQRKSFSIYRAEIERIYSQIGINHNPTVATFCALGTILWFLKWYKPEGKCSFEEVVDTIIRYVIKGVTGLHDFSQVNQSQDFLSLPSNPII